MNPSAIRLSLFALLAALLVCAASAQPTVTPTTVPLTVNKTTGAITGPVDAATFKTANSLGGSGAGSGDVVGPASATDNAVARFDSTTGKLLQGSSVTISDAGVITAASIVSGSGNLTFQGASSGALVTVGEGSNGSLRFTLPGTGLVNLDSSATATQARLNINLLSPGVAATQEAVVSYQAYDSAGNYRQIGAMGAYWVDAGATGYSAVFLHADDYNGGGSNNDVRVSAGHGILLFATDNVFPGSGILEVRGTLAMKGSITTDNNYTATSATPVMSLVSNSNTAFAQFQAANSTGRLLTWGSFGDSKTGTTAGISNSALAYVLTGTTSGSYNTGLALGTGGGTAPIYFISGGSLVGTLGASSFDLAVPITNGTATTPSANDNDTSIATTAYVQTELTAYASDTVTFTNKSFALGSNTLTGTSAQLATALSDETGSGAAVFASSPALIGPRILPSSGTAIGRIIADPARADVFLVGNNFGGSSQDDTGKPSYYLSFDSRVAGDAWKVFRVPAAGSATEALTVDATGTTVHGLLRAGSSPTTLTDSAGKVLTAALNTVGVGQGGTGTTTAPSSGQLLVASGSTAYAPVTMSGAATISSSGVVTIANSGVTAGSYTSANITVGADGRITAASNGSGSGGWATGLLFTTTSSSTVISNSISDTNLFSGTIPGGTLGTSGAVKFLVHGTVTNMTGVNRTLNISVKYGSTTLWKDTTSNIGSNSTARPFNIEGILFADNSATAQRLVITNITLGPAATATTGYGDIAGSPIIFFSPAAGGTASETSSGDLTLAISMELSIADANYSVVVHKAAAWKL